MFIARTRSGRSRTNQSCSGRSHESESTCSRSTILRAFAVAAAQSGFIARRASSYAANAPRTTAIWRTPSRRAQANPAPFTDVIVKRVGSIDYPVLLLVAAAIVVSLSAVAYGVVILVRRAVAFARALRESGRSL